MAKKINPIVGSSLIGAGAGAAQDIIGMIGQKKRYERSVKDTKDLMGIQQMHQQELNRQGQELAMKTWHETNYGPQMEKMKEAGLNPSLMYGMSGGGGATTSAGSGGSAASGSAPAPQPMEIGNMIAGAKDLAQVALMKAQERNINADTDNKKSGTSGSDIDNMLKAAGIEDKVKREEILAALEAKKAESDVKVDLGKSNDAPEWNDGEKLNRYEADRVEKLKTSSIENLLKKAQEGLAKATGSNLISNDEMIRLQTELLKAEMGLIESDAFKKLPGPVQAILMVLMKKLGGK